MDCARLGWMVAGDGPSTNSFKFAADMALNMDDTDHSDEEDDDEDVLLSLSLSEEDDASSLPVANHHK